MNVDNLVKSGAVTQTVAVALDKMYRELQGEVDAARWRAKVASRTAYFRPNDSAARYESQRAQRAYREAFRGAQQSLADALRDARTS